jgi:hypothetical protein
MHFIKALTKLTSREKGTRLLLFSSSFGVITFPLREGKIFCKKILGGVKKEKGVGLFLFLDLHHYKF